jgi:phosphohistidine swiveling domain-containing protein
MNKNKRISKFDGTKKWAGKFSLSNAFYNAEFDLKINKKVLGCGFRSVLFIHERGITSYYRSERETDKFGKFLAEKFTKNKKLISFWSDKLITNYNKILKLLKLPANVYLDKKNYLKIEKALADFHPYLMAVYTIPDYLENKSYDKYFLDLERARKYSEPLYDELDKFFSRFFQIISKKEKINIKLLMSLNIKEIHEYLNNKKLPPIEILSSRYNNSAFYYSNGKLNKYSGKYAEKIKKIINSHVKNRSDILIGSGAYPGKIRGTVKIIHNPSEKNKFNKGDVLVTGMTRPDFIIFIKKSAAIITDAGGVLSHAAIIARELKKPCIIGTKIATQVLKDGDLAEVDANKGIVKILKKA